MDTLEVARPIPSEVSEMSDEGKRDWALTASLDEAMAYSLYLLTKTQQEIQLTHELTATLGLMSGGNDSTTFMHLFHHHFDWAVHINTGIGVEETRQFVRDVCSGWDLPLIEQSPPPGATYEELVMRFGFPGPAGHMLMYTRLKERGLRAVRKRFVPTPRKQRVLFVAGMRHFESSRRMRNTDETSTEGSIVWCSPLAWWTNDHMKQYRERFTVPFNEVSANLHMSGECLCGAFAKPDELEQIRFFYPATAAYIDSLQERAKEAGVHCVWGTRPPRKQKAPKTHTYWSCDCDIDETYDYQAENAIERLTGHMPEHHEVCITGEWVTYTESQLLLDLEGELDGEVGLLCRKCEPGEELVDESETIVTVTSGVAA